MRKRIANKLITDEKGQALIIVIILMLVGGLIIAPLLGFMSTGLIVGQVHEERMAELYAADAGIEDALWKIMNIPDPPETYFLTVNGKEVMIVITTTTTGDFLADLFGGTQPASPHADWMLVYHSPDPGVFIVEITYEGTPENKYITGVGAWLQGTYTYEENSASGITGEYPEWSLEVKPYSGGTAFIWEWTGSGRPEFGKKTGVYSRTLTFEFDPADVPTLAIGWATAGSNDIWISAEGGFTTNVITAIATDSSTGKQTTVVAHATGTDEGTVDIVTWEISLQ